jgi:(2Fe-2S) ferredoxin
MPKPQKFVFVCLNQRDPAHARPSCAARGAGDVFAALRDEQGLRRNTDVKIVATGCLEACMVGPVIAVHPDDVWYGGVTEEDAALLMDHFEGGEPVAPLVLDGSEWDLRPPAMEP